MKTRATNVETEGRKGEEEGVLCQYPCPRMPSSSARRRFRCPPCLCGLEHKCGGGSGRGVVRSRCTSAWIVFVISCPGSSLGQWAREMAKLVIRGRQLLKETVRDHKPAVRRQGNSVMRNSVKIMDSILRSLSLHHTVVNGNCWCGCSE